MSKAGEFKTNLIFEKTKTFCCTFSDFRKLRKLEIDNANKFETENKEYLDFYLLNSLF